MTRSVLTMTVPASQQPGRTEKSLHWSPWPWAPARSASLPVSVFDDEHLGLERSSPQAATRQCSGLPLIVQPSSSCLLGHANLLVLLTHRLLGFLLMTNYFISAVLLSITRMLIVLAALFFLRNHGSIILSFSTACFTCPTSRRLFPSPGSTQEAALRGEERSL